MSQRNKANAMITIFFCNSQMGKCHQNSKFRHINDSMIISNLSPTYNDINMSTPCQMSGGIHITIIIHHHISYYIDYPLKASY